MMVLIEIEDGKPTERSARSRSSADTEYFLVSYRFPLLLGCNYENDFFDEVDDFH